VQIGAPRPVSDLPTLVARDLAAVGSRTLPFAVEAGDAATLERYFAASSGPRVRVIDLAMMQIALEGATRHTLAGRPSGLYSYQTPSGARLVCQMYEGRLSDLPPPESIRAGRCARCARPTSFRASMAGRSAAPTPAILRA